MGLELAISNVIKTRETVFLKRSVKLKHDISQFRNPLCHNWFCGSVACVFVSGDELSLWVWCPQRRSGRPNKFCLLRRTTFPLPPHCLSVSSVVRKTFFFGNLLSKTRDYCCYQTANTQQRWCTKSYSSYSNLLILPNVAQPRAEAYRISQFDSMLFMSPRCLKHFEM